MNDEDEPIKLNDCTPGDIVAVSWRDHGTELNGTDQLVMYFGAIHSVKRREQETALSSIVELVDPETLMPYTHGVINELNMFIVDNFDVLDIVKRSKYAKLDNDVERKVARQDDLDDPLLRRANSQSGELMKG